MGSRRIIPKPVYDPDAGANRASVPHRGKPNRTMTTRIRSLLLHAVLLGSIALAACRAPDGSSAQRSAHRSRAARDKAVTIRRIACIYEQRPWLNLDAAGDRDPEGIWFRVFLDPGSGRGVHAKGMFHVEMYQIGRTPEGEPTRTLVSDWHYPSSKIARIAKPGMLGDGYMMQLRWASKSIAGNEVEVITRFEDAMGNVVRSGTKRLRVPKYES